MAIRATILSAVLLLCAKGAAGAPESRPAAAGGPVAATLGTPFELGFDKTASLADVGLELRFAKVLEDSRCPAGMVCVWAGRVRLLLQVKMAGSEAGEVTLSTLDQVDGKLPTLGSYAFRLISVQPVGKASPEQEPSAYVAKIEVTQP